jgi:FAD/FMN-containing dehydrogenase
MKNTAKAPALSPDLIERFRAIVGPAHTLTDPDQQLPYVRELRDLYDGRASLVLRPGSTQEVSKILALANEHGLPVVPQAGNTGLVGGQVPMNGEIVLSISRLKKVRALDAQGFTMTVEAGMTLADVHAAADNINRLFPLSLPSEGTCQIGGNLGTNAGGVGVLAYGNARQLVLGLEVVLADGRIWNGLSPLKKDNTGYDLRDLFIGSEGTLGVITAATLKLFPKPVEMATAFVALPSVDAALPLFSLAQEAAGQSLTAFEIMCETALDMVLKHAHNTRDPFSVRHPWYALIEISGLKEDGNAERLLMGLLETATERELLLDATIASSLTQQRDFWRLRESYSESQRPEGDSIKTDVSVPTQKIPEFIKRADAAVFAINKEARPAPLSHFGDGNVHYNISQPAGWPKGKFMEQWKEISGAVHAIVLEFGGSISAEHGIGIMKRDELARIKDPVALDLMRRIKSTFDPRGILNPGKVL